MNDPIVDTETIVYTYISILIHVLNDERSDCGYWNLDCAGLAIFAVSWTMNDPIVDTETTELIIYLDRVFDVERWTIL